MGSKGSNRAGPSLGFSNDRFLALMADLTGITPVGYLGRETPLDLSSLEAARGSLLLSEVFSKYDDGLPSPEKEATTWKRFHEAEDTCRRTNESFYAIAQASPFWRNVRRRIWDLLGVFSWDEASKHFAFGPGSTTRLTHRERFAAYKYSGIPESTLGNAVLASCAIRMIPLWNQSVRASAEEKGIEGLVSLVPGNSVIVVPKNWKTGRTIAKEPCMNIYVQKGLGRMIRRRLHRVGVNLDDQTRNQRAALLGSVTGALATLDLTMASDTLAYEVVSWLLPNDWWWALEQCRSPVGVLTDGTKIKYQKFSSMGNGYTFELESLIFWAICQQVCCSNIAETDMSVCVYGDDLVVPSAHYDQITERLLEAGFTPNLKKSFASGPYRESCGKHYYLGSDITPFYVRKPVLQLDRLFLVHNNVYRWGDRTGVDVDSVTASLQDLAPAKWRDPRLPDGYGDGAFIGPVDALRLDPHPFGWEYWQVFALAQTSIELSDELPVGQMMASLLKSSSGRSLLSRSTLARCPPTPRPVRARQSPHRIELRKTRVEQMTLQETDCGLPVREGKYREIEILVPRYPRA